MPDHQLVWGYDAIAEYQALLKRRTDKDGIRKCVEGHLLAVAGNLGLARPWNGPGDFLTYDFQCKDGDVTIYVRAVLQRVNDDKIAVLSCAVPAL